MTDDVSLDTRRKKFRLAILASHPVPYQVPIYRGLAKNPDVDLMVYFCDDRGLKEKLDPGFGISFKWRVPLLDGYPCTFLKNYGIGSDFFFLGKINPGILPELWRGRYDAVIVTGYVYVTNWFVFLTRWFTHARVILRGEADLLKATSDAPLRLLKRLMKNTILPLLFGTIDAFLYSYTLNKEYFKHYGVPEEKLFFLPCAVDNDFFRSQAAALRGKRDAVKDAIGIRNKEIPTIIFTGKFNARKRPLDLLIAYDMVKDRAPANIVLVGDGPEKPRLLHFAEEKRLKNVFFIGFQDQSEISTFYFISDIFVLPTEFDPSSKTINEAMNFSLAIITSDRASTGFDLILKGQSGFMYPMGDTAALAKCLEELIANPRRREEFGRHALKTVSEWSIEKDVEGIIEALSYVSRK